jgi:UDP-glucose 4-epimerase
MIILIVGGACYIDSHVNQLLHCSWRDWLFFLYKEYNKFRRLF